jgi:hypothetical protein
MLALLSSRKRKRQLLGKDVLRNRVWHEELAEAGDDEKRDLEVEE